MYLKYCVKREGYKNPYILELNRLKLRYKWVNNNSKAVVICVIGVKPTKFKWSEFNSSELVN